MSNQQKISINSDSCLFKQRIIRTEEEGLRMWAGIILCQEGGWRLGRWFGLFKVFKYWQYQQSLLVRIRLVQKSKVSHTS